MELSIWGWLSPVTCVPVGPQSLAEADEVATSVQAATRAMTLRMYLALDTCSASSARELPQRERRRIGRPSFSGPPSGLDLSPLGKVGRRAVGYATPGSEAGCAGPALGSGVRRFLESWECRTRNRSACSPGWCG